MPDQILDTKGLNCPLPILKMKKTLAGMNPGMQLQILATDPGAVNDFEAYCHTSGHALLESVEEDGIFRFLIQKN
jgi:tRNA 2-thiouridine synthesizing protein A